MPSTSSDTAAAPRLGATGHSTATDARTAGHDAALGALDGLAPQAADLMIIFANASYDLEALLAGAQAAAGPAPVVGCTTVGAFTADTQVATGCVAMHLAGGDELSFGVTHVSRDDADLAGSARAAAEAARARAGEEHPHSVLMLLCDGLTPDQRELYRGAYEVTSAVVPLVGGAAGDDLVWQRTWTFGEGRILHDGLLCVWINGARPMGVGVGHGWRPFGKPMLVTRAEGATIHELDGIPAMDAYLSERGAALGDGASFGAMAMERPIGLPNARGRYDLRQIHMPAPGGGIVLTTGVPEQTIVQVMAGEADLLLDGAREAAEAVAAELDGPPRLALVFSCCTRAPLLGERLAEEVDTISTHLGGVPAAGFYTCGEFARATGSTGIHNSSVAILGFG